MSSSSTVSPARATRQVPGTAQRRRGLALSAAVLLLALAAAASLFWGARSVDPATVVAVLTGLPADLLEGGWAQVSAGLGIDVGRLFSLTFAVGSGLAGLGGALGAEIVGIDPTLPLRCLVPLLIVVAVGGTSSVTGPLRAALLLGIADVAGKYFVPRLGGALVYLVAIALLMWRPRGLFARGGGR